ncbi:MAG: S-layer homology domain-containing protein, partial [Clostridia bacterium]|nr:S-layer homology domain-containing protein [Clostridia bacterium]
MKKRFCSALLALAMMLSLIPGMIFTASAEDVSSEIIAFNNSETAESEHFTLTTNEVDAYGWYAVSDWSSIVIEAKSKCYEITAIEAFVNAYGSNYPDAVYSSGEKVETGEVDNDTTVHVNNIFANRLEISSKSTQYIALKNIRVYYTQAHSPVSAPDCTVPELCMTCHEVVGPALGHLLSAPDCIVPELCLRCHKVIAPALGHDFSETCEQYSAEQHMRTCKRCKEIEYSDHVWRDFICTDCGAEDVAGAKADAGDAIVEAMTEGNYTIGQKAFFDVGAADTVADVMKIKYQALVDMARNANNRSASETYYTLSFHTNGGSALGIVSGTFGIAIDLSKYVPSKEGYAFGGWYSDSALTESVSEIRLTGDKTVYAKWIGKSPAARVLPFTDVKKTDWSYDDIAYVYENGLMNGTSATTFSPKTDTSRAMIVTILWRLEGAPVVNYAMSFKDVAPGQWYTEAIRWAQANGIVNG